MDLDDIARRLSRLEADVNQMRTELGKREKRKAFRKLSNKPTFKGRVLDWMNERSKSDWCAPQIAKALNADVDAVGTTLANLASDGFIERTRHGYYRGFADDEIVS